ncbi:xyloglucanase [Ideonella sp. DXS29W]|uniref:Xyloglucanase n=1 Tax=Ideonella lacteola TaxID=2984193 RepID=A0ABU9BST2_9BURK
MTFPLRHQAWILVLATSLAAISQAAVTQAAGVSAAEGAPAPLAATYSWKNVPIRGGGFISGIVFSQAQKDLIYARTDIGGMYRWSAATKSWKPLLDWVGWKNWGYNGVVSVAADPSDANRVYAAVGMYTNSWDPNNGAMLRSDDQGRTWQTTPLPFKLGGNMPGRGMGERLAVDPNQGKVLYFGAPSGKGLWKSVDRGATWAQVESFPNPGNYVADPNDTSGYLSDNQGVLWVAFDPRSSQAGKASRVIYVGVADKQNIIYRSNDAGATWERVANQPVGYLPQKGVLDPVNGFLYIATSDTGGPYDGSKGDVWKLNTATGAWTQISPIPSSSADAYFGYTGITVDRQNPKVLMVATQISWWPDGQFFRSTDGGATWTRAWEFTSYPSRSFRYTMDVSDVPWLTFGASPQPPEVTPKLGWMTQAVEIDPFNSNRFMYGTGATLYGSDNLLNWDQVGGSITIKPMVKGLEETAVLDLVSPPSGPPLISALGDIGGFRHDDLKKVPALMHVTPNFTSTNSMDFAELNPSVVARVGQLDKTAFPYINRIGVSSDGGHSWYGGQEPAGGGAGGVIAVAADASTFVWSPSGGAPVVYSISRGSSWAVSSGVPAGAQVRSDRVNPSKFYAFAAGRFYRSTNGGASFAETTASNLPALGNVKFKTVPGREGDIWLAGGSTSGAYGLWHSTDGGASFSKVKGVQEADNIGFGKAPDGANYPTLYAVAKAGGARGLFRSLDAGASWQRINDNDHQYGNFGEALTGDPRVFGRVYVGTNGRGIIIGEPK